MRVISITFLGAAVIITIVFGTLYVALQQLQRSDADYPQTQMAEDAASALNQGVAPRNLVGSKVDMSASLAPFTIIFNKTGRIIAGSGYLHGAIPTAPFGMLAAASDRPYNIVTWQPNPSLRIAAVTVAARNYFVLSGRSLKVIELNENVTLILSGFGWIASLVVLIGTYYLVLARQQPSKAKP